MIYGARLLDVLVPVLGVPAGVALDAGSEDGTLFPPVAGIVPEEVGVAVAVAGIVPEEVAVAGIVPEGVAVDLDGAADGDTDDIN